MNGIFIVGCGGLGKKIAALWLEKGESVAALVRSPIHAEDLDALGVEVVEGDLDRPESLQDLPLNEKLVYYFAPPPSTGMEDARMKSFCRSALARQKPERLVYVSTSGVYGNRNGAWVDESASPKPATDRALRRVSAEQTLRAWEKENNGTVIVLRVPGIYGPGRLPLARIRKGVPVIAENESPVSNRIHIDDLAQICQAAGQRGQAGDIFNVADQSDASMTDYFNAVADVFKLPRPPQISLKQAESVLSPEMLSYLRESRRLDTTRLHRKLQVSLRYPDLLSGLKACREQDEND